MILRDGGRAGGRPVDLGGPSVDQGGPKFQIKLKSRRLQKSKLVDWGAKHVDWGAWPPLGAGPGWRFPICLRDMSSMINIDAIFCSKVPIDRYSEIKCLLKSLIRSRSFDGREKKT